MPISARTTPPATGDTLNTPPRLPGKVAVAQKLGSQIPLDLMFRNERGEIVRLRQLFFKERPVLLNFVYFNCPMLCPMTLEGTANSLTHLKLDIGKDFDVITVSIDPRDKTERAAELKEKYVKHYGRLSAANGWHFLTANETTIKKLTDSLGFQFSYDPPSDQFAHAAVLHVLTEEGVASKYFYGFEHKPLDLRLALIEASVRKIGTFTDQLLLLCFHYDPSIGKYSRNAMNFVRAGSVTAVFALTGFIVVMVRREKFRKES
ncbi:MAG TPA: SCO family protein [Thermoanaerobaculia bacterium]